LGKYKYGPGTKKKNIKIAKAFKVTVGTVQDKHRPTDIYCNLSTWVKPTLKATKAVAAGDMDASGAAKKSAKSFEYEMESSKKRWASNFSSEYFDTSSIIIAIDYVPEQADVAKAQFLDIAIHMQTTNAVDNWDDMNPAPYNGKTNMYNFNDLLPHFEKGLKKILDTPLFKNNPLVTFQMKKK
jgi:hypothetical protein